MLGVIALLLAIIAAVLLFGNGPVLIVLGVLAALAVVIWIAASLGSMIRQEREAGRAGYFILPLLAGAALAGFALFIKDQSLLIWGGGIEALAFPVAALETASKWGPKLPGRLAYFARYVAVIFSGPVVAPYRRLVEIRQRRAQGETITTAQAAGAIVAVFAVSVGLFLFGVIMAGLLAGYVFALFH